MLSSSFRTFAAFACVLLLAMCLWPGPPAEPVQSVSGIATDSVFKQSEFARQEVTVVTFRAEYFVGKECEELQKGTLAMIQVHHFEVTEVLGGNLRIKRFKMRSAPAGARAAAVQTWRMKLTELMRKELRKAEQEGFTGMWLSPDALEVVESEQQ